MKRLLIIFALALFGCKKTEVPPIEYDRCSYCYYTGTDSLYTYMCDDYLLENTDITLEELTDIWDVFTGLECEIKD
jgi:hypothetical protein